MQFLFIKHNTWYVKTLDIDWLDFPPNIMQVNSNWVLIWSYFVLTRNLSVDWVKEVSSIMYNNYQFLLLSITIINNGWIRKIV